MSRWLWLCVRIIHLCEPTRTLKGCSWGVPLPSLPPTPILWGACLHVCNCTHTVQYMYYVATITKPSESHHVYISSASNIYICVRWKHISRYMIDTRPQNLQSLSCCGIGSLQRLCTTLYKSGSGGPKSSIGIWILNDNTCKDRGPMPLQTSSHTLPFHNALQLSTLRSYYCPNSQLAFQHPSQLHQLDITMIIIITFELLTSLPISL